MRVVISGATSMIGIACIKACIARGCEVLAIVRQGTKRLARLPESPLISLAYGDLDTLDRIQGDGRPYDVFYHFAWSHTSKAERDDPIAQEHNIRATLQAVELAHRLGCRKFIGAGSQAEYGSVEGVISAVTQPEPVIAYGMAKLSSCMLSKRLCQQYGMEHIWGRIFSVYGTNDNEGTMLNYAIDQFLEGEPAIFSAATQLWNYLYEEDAGEMFCRLGKMDVPSGIYCIAHPESRPLRSYIEQLRELFGEEAQCTFAPVDPAGKPVSLQVDMKKTLDAIGYNPRISFSDGICAVIKAREKKKGELRK